MATKKKDCRKEVVQEVRQEKFRRRRPPGRPRRSRARSARRAPRSCVRFSPTTPSSAVVGSSPLPRTELTKKLWAYIKRNGLQDSKNRRAINADDKLRPVFGGKSQVTMFDMTKLVNKHVS